MPDLNVENANVVGGDALDSLNTILTIPVSKLDADQYSAEDIDGVTESIFGSGNLAYASLQASQTDAAIALGDALSLGSDDILFGEDPGADGGSRQAGADAGYGGGLSGYSPALSADGDTDTDRPVESGSFLNSDNLGSEGSFANTTVGSLSASTLSSDVGSFSSSSNLDLGGDVLNDQTSTTTNNQTNVSQTDVTTNIDNSTVTNNENIDMGDLIQDIVNLGDELIENIFEGDINETIEILTTEITEITEILTTEINNITEQVTNITNELTETVTNIFNELLDGGPITIDLASGILDTLGGSLHATIDDSILGQLSTDLVNGNLSSLLNEFLGLNIPFITDTGANVGFNLLGGGVIDDGNDLSIAGLQTPDIDLALIEDIIGDLDINVSLPMDLLNPDTLMSGLGDLAASLSNLSLADPADILGILGTQGANGALDILIGDTSVLGEDFAVDVDDLLGQMQGITDSLSVGELDLLNGLDTGGLGDVLGGLDAGGLDGALGGLDVGGLGDTLGGLDAGGLLDGAGGLTDVLGGGSGGGNLLGDIIETVIETVDDLSGEIDLDIIDDLTGGLGGDLGVGDAIGLLTEAGEGVGDAIGGILGGDGAESTWTESIIDNGIGLFDDLVGGVGGGDVLPDPLGTVAEGLGVLDIVPSLPIGGLGGLFG